MTKKDVNVPYCSAVFALIFLILTLSNMASKEQSQKTTKTLACFSPKSSSSTSSEKGVEGTILLDDLFSTTCSLFVIKRSPVSFSKKPSAHASEKVLCYSIAYLCQMSKDVFP